MAAVYAVVYRSPIPLRFDATDGVTLELLLYPAGTSQFGIEHGAVLGLLVARLIVLAGLGLAGGTVARLVADGTDRHWRPPAPTAVRLAAYPCLLDVTVCVLAAGALSVGSILPVVTVAGVVAVAPWLFFVVPVIALEHRPILASIGTSRERARGSWLPILGTLLAFAILETSLGSVPRYVPVVQDSQSAAFPVGTLLSIVVVGTVYAVVSARWYEGRTGQ